MEKSELFEFLDLNGLTFEQLADSVHNDIKEAILKKICEFMKESHENEAFVKKIYRRRSDPIVSTSLIVTEITNCKLSNKDLHWMNECIHAYFNKKDKRKSLKQIGENLWHSGCKHCAICGTPVELDTLNVDHIIPWDYVGDELPNNYQILCEHCNKTKGANISQTLEKLIFNKKGE